MSVARFAPLLLSALCLSACAAAPSSQAVGRYRETADKPSGEPLLASLPATAGRLVAVRRIPYTNGIGQEIVLEGPRAMAGENRITVQVLTSRTGASGQDGEELKLAAPSSIAIAAEMERRLPGMAMSIAAAPEHDAEGAIGYATGTKDRLSCVYAWQYLGPERPLSFLEGLSDVGSLTVSARVRLCREQPVAALVEVLRGLRIMRPGSDLEPAPGSVAAVGDALDAAVGSMPTPVPATGVTGTEPGLVRPIRRAARHHAVKRHASTSRHGLMHSKPQVAEASFPALPRLPGPEEVQPRATPQRSPNDALPLPGATGDTL